MKRMMKCPLYIPSNQNVDHARHFIFFDHTIWFRNSSSLINLHHKPTIFIFVVGSYRLCECWCRSWSGNAKMDDCRWQSFSHPSSFFLYCLLLPIVVAMMTLIWIHPWIDPNHWWWWIKGSHGFCNSWYNATNWSNDWWIFEKHQDFSLGLLMW